jgi:hypothetical protein
LGGVTGDYTTITGAVPGRSTAVGPARALPPGRNFCGPRGVPIVIHPGFLKQFGSRPAVRASVQGGNFVTPIVNQPLLANPSHPPIVVLADMRRQCPAMLPQFAGAAGESTHSSMPIDTFHRNHKVTSLSDASAGRAQQDVPANQFHYVFYAFSKIPGLYCDGRNQRPEQLNLTKQVH